MADPPKSRHPSRAHDGPAPKYPASGADNGARRSADWSTKSGILRLSRLTAVARDAFGGTVLWPIARTALFVVFAATCLDEVSRLLPASLTRQARAAGEVLWRLAAGGWLWFRVSLEPKHAPQSRWGRRAFWAWDVVFGTGFALYLFTWFGLLLVAAAYARGPGATVGLRCLAVVYAAAPLTMARIFGNVARDGWYRLRHEW